MLMTMIRKRFPIFAITETLRWADYHCVLLGVSGAGDIPKRDLLRPKYFVVGGYMALKQN